ncbi:MAG TPA: hypothetical protein VHU89_17800 [Acidobacteriaceae bacterium]|nr:hypothetical protein [Acidobacteriaceae bacterium]
MRLDVSGSAAIRDRGYSLFVCEEEDDPDEGLAEPEEAGVAGFSDFSPDPEDSAAFPLPSADAFMEPPLFGA